MRPLHSRHIKPAMQVLAEIILKTLEPLIKLSVSANSANSPGFCSIHTLYRWSACPIFWKKPKQSSLSSLPVTSHEPINPPQLQRPNNSLLCFMSKCSKIAPEDAF